MNKRLHYADLIKKLVSCENRVQLSEVVREINEFNKKYFITPSSEEFKKFETIIGLMKIKLKHKHGITESKNYIISENQLKFIVENNKVNTLVSKRDLSFVIRKLLNGFVNDHKDILCEVEVKYLGEKIKLPHSDNNYENYRVTFYFIAHKGGYSSTRAQLMGKAMNEARDLINAFIGIEVDLFPMYVNQCE